MKKLIGTTAFLAVIAMATTSCQKGDNDPFDSTGVIMSNLKINYVANGLPHSVTLLNDDDWDLFFDNIFALAKDGYLVIVQGNGSQSSITKETVTFTTTIEDEAKAWMKEKIGQGYSVSLEYDKSTGIYTCTATK